MTAQTSGLHHVTAIAGDPQRNIDFYIQGLGLRLVKRTVNFDDPSTYHLYYGDESGRPGSLLTFFPWRGVPAGRVGAGQSTSTAFSVPQHSVGWWRGHFIALGVEPTIVSVEGEDRLVVRDPDGLVLELVASATEDPRDPWDTPAVPAEHAVRGQHSSVLTVADADSTLRVLIEDLGMSMVWQAGGRSRVVAGEGGPGRIIDVVAQPGARRGLIAGGTVHHIAFRVPDRATQEKWRQDLIDRGHRVTEILDRQYFTSIYFREPGGVLFEIATDTPGFSVDEPLLELGRMLKLPPWLEPTREDIEHSLQQISLPPENNPTGADQ